MDEWPRHRSIPDTGAASHRGHGSRASRAEPNHRRGWGPPSEASIAQPYDVDKAVQYLDGHATPYYTKTKNGHCGTAVRQAIGAGGIKLAVTHSAKDYGPILMATGFNQLDAAGMKNYTPEVGDVMIYPAFVPQNGKAHVDGHIQMFDGTQWVSDFKQHGKYNLGLGVLPGNAFANQPFTVYRR